MTSAMGRKKRGVTLIELTMVGLLLGLLAMIAWPSVRLGARQVIDRSHSEREALDRRLARENSLRGAQEAR